MQGMRTTVSGAIGQLLRLDHSHNRRIVGIGLGIEHMNTRRAQTGNNQVAPLDMGMRSVGTKGRTARIPSEVMQFIADVRHIHAAHDLAVMPGTGLDIDDDQCVRLMTAICADGSHIGQCFSWRLHRQLRRSIKSWIGFPEHRNRLSA